VWVGGLERGRGFGKGWTYVLHAAADDDGGEHEIGVWGGEWRCGQAEGDGDVLEWAVERVLAGLEVVGKAEGWVRHGSVRWVGECKGDVEEAEGQCGEEGGMMMHDRLLDRT
jgi:hypothetical protein